MSCNPSIGGLGKGHLVREIDALGGEMAKCIDLTGIQFKMLNRSKGPAVQGNRAQADKPMYRLQMKATLEQQEGLEIKQGTVERLLLRDGRIAGVMTSMGFAYGARAVVVTTGTFLRGLIHIGLKHQAGGRGGEGAAYGLSEQLMELGFQMGRLKTGTPPRLDAKTIDFSNLEPQPVTRAHTLLVLNRGHYPAAGAVLLDLYQCHHAPDHSREPGSFADVHRGDPGTRRALLPVDRRQDRALCRQVAPPDFPGARRTAIRRRCIPTASPPACRMTCRIALCAIPRGLESAHIMRPGYAIEYDYFDPRATEVLAGNQACRGLFFAGQINGTTGYEEAAAQGLLAGINAARMARGASACWPRPL